MKKVQLLFFVGIIVIFFNSCEEYDNTTLAVLTKPNIVNSSITQNSAECITTITSDGGAAVTSRGVCWSTEMSFDINHDFHTSDGEGVGAFNSLITGLLPNTTYNVRSYAINSKDIQYSNSSTFTTLAIVQTKEVTIMTFNTARIGGKITSLEGNGEIADCGICWSETEYPTINDNKTSEIPKNNEFTSLLTELKVNTLYYARAFVSNGGGTEYGEQLIFTIPLNVPGPDIIDVEGNIYKSVKIGNQIWMAENLRTTKYRDNTPLVNCTSLSELEIHKFEDFCCDYNFDPTNGSIYGKLYSHRVINDSAEIAPEGWHIPSEEEWLTLINFLGGSNSAGGKLKEIGTEYWFTPNAGATNESGFSALPGGKCYADGYDCYFYGKGTIAYYWCSNIYHTYDIELNASLFFLRYSNASIERFLNRRSSGHSIRCIKD